ncbi:MAG: HAMP domain-containing protein [Nitrospirae bacterium]|nr:HAMP domain-containing protein [Nitrospirota bacterium]
MKNLRFPLFISLIILFIITVFSIEFHYIGLKDVPVLTKVLLFVLLNLNLVALLTLMFFVGKSLIRLYFERKQKVLGYKLKTRFVVVLVVMTLIPSAFLFVVSSGVVTNYLDRWFDPQIKQPLDLAVEVAKSAYEMQRQQTLVFARAATAGLTLPEGLKAYTLRTIPADASDIIKAGFEGKEDVEIISTKTGDIVRAVVPRNRQNPHDGIVVVESVMDSSITRNAGMIQAAYKNYLTLDSWKMPMKTNYLLILGFSTLLMVFMALWTALRISRGITDPIQALAQATAEVAKGNLDMSVNIERDDEIGLLISSFNNMVRDLKENKESLQHASQVSDRRRLVIEKILENVNSGVISLDAEGNILIINNAACRILNIDPSDVMNKKYDTLLSLIDSDELRETVKGIIIRDFKGVEKEIRIMVGEKRILLRLFITSLRDTGNFMGTLVVFDDLTEITRAQKAIAWQEVARRIAHEIKNPLTPIKLSTDHMVKKWQNKDEDFGKVFERSTKTIIREVESLKRLVDEFSRFGKMPEIRKAPAMLSSIIESVINLYKDYKDIEMHLSLKGSETPIELDAEQFKRVIINIVNNAIQAMQNQGRLDIMIHQDALSNRVYVDIADNGPGIREEDKEKLFLPYFSTRKDGTGLGLAIASRVVTEHRGYIRVRDNKPHGTIFSIELPIKEG